MSTVNGRSAQNELVWHVARPVGAAAGENILW